MKIEHAVIRMDALGRRAWLKVYAEGNRGWTLAVLDLLTRFFDTPSLRPPAHWGGERACAIEKRRIEALVACGALVPEILGQGANALLLGDIGHTLKSVLHEVGPERQVQLIAQAARAMVEVHAHDGYIGQPYARNLTVAEDGRIGFLDLEEDPLESMTLAQAQVRDWLIFAAGVSRYFADPSRQFADAIRPVLRDETQTTRLELLRQVRRLRLVERISGRLGARAKRIAGALAGLRNALES